MQGLDFSSNFGLIDKKAYKLKKIKDLDLLVFCKYCNLALSNNIDLFSAFNLFTKGDISPRLKYFVKVLIERLKSGDKMSEICLEIPKDGALWSALFRVAENTGDFAQSFSGLVKYLEWKLNIINKIKKALRYPMISSVLVFSTLIFFIFWVVPKLYPVFSSIREGEVYLDKPYESFVNVLWSVSGLMLMGLSLYSILKAKNRLHSFLITIPGIGKIVKYYHYTFLFNILYVATSAKVGLIESFDLSGKFLKDIKINEKFERIIYKISQGYSLSETISKDKYFDDLIVSSITLAETSNSLDSAFQFLYNFYNKELETKIEGILGLIEPISIVSLGLFMGLVIYHIFTPIYQIIGNIPF